MATLSTTPCPRAAAPTHRARRGCRTCRAGATDTAAKLPELQPVNDEYKQLHAFTSYANWLIPGHLMVGRYPFMEPSRCTDRSQGEAQLDKILSAGITTFVSLQSELPPQERMPLSGVNGFFAYKSTADLIAACLTGPPPSEVVEGLRNPYLDQFVPPRRRPASAAYQSYKPIRPTYVHYPYVDMAVPPMDVLESTVSDVAARLMTGERMLVHCWGGRGRAGLVGACVLAQAYGLSADEALQRVQLAFETRNDTERRSPQTDEQIQMVREFCDRRQ